MSKIAHVRERITVRPADPALALRLEKELRIPAVAARILAGRNFTDADHCRRFFNPTLEGFHDPFLFRDMEKAVSRIMAALAGGEKIAVYGDYDVDGITGTAMLVRALRSIGAAVDYFMPNRLTEGYGVSTSGVRLIAASGAKLMITVDCGITAIEEIALARKLGIEVIVTDHHEPKESLPAAIALINPKLAGSGYPDHDLAGVGVVLKLCQALTRATGRAESLWEPYLDLAALGTVADIVPLRGENRIIARFGFERLRSTNNCGLAALIELQGLSGKRISTSDTVFKLAPCINAAGRIGDPRRAVELLLTDVPEEAMAFAGDLRIANLERRSIDAEVWREVSEWVLRSCEEETDFAIVTGSAAWHAGVIGIVASKLVERFYRPAILFSIGSDGSARGSGRSIPGLDLVDALGKCADLLDTFGGHAAAAGMSCKAARIGEFRERFNEVVRSRVAPEDLVPRVQADAEAELTAVTPQLFSFIKSMEPFGPGNMRPVLYCKNLHHRYAPRIVGDNHVKMTVTKGGFVMDAIAFNFGERFGEIKTSPLVSLAFSVDENEWNGRKALQMDVKGMTL